MEILSESQKQKKQHNMIDRQGCLHCAQSISYLFQFRIEICLKIVCLFCQGKIYSNSPWIKQKTAYCCKNQNVQIRLTRRNNKKNKNGENWKFLLCARFTEVRLYRKSEKKWREGKRIDCYNQPFIQFTSSTSEQFVSVFSTVSNILPFRGCKSNTFFGYRDDFRWRVLQCISDTRK